MEYKLAKELKDNGFPMPTQPTAWCVTKEHEDYKEDISQSNPIWDLPDKTAMYLPTLSELIEATVKLSQEKDTLEGFRLHITPNDEWTVSIGITEFVEGGKSPEEAVARLWLALNKKY